MNEQKKYLAFRVYCSDDLQDYANIGIIEVIPELIELVEIYSAAVSSMRPAASAVEFYTDQRPDFYLFRDYDEKTVPEDILKIMDNDSDVAVIDRIVEFGEPLRVDGVHVKVDGGIPDLFGWSGYMKYGPEVSTPWISTKWLKEKYEHHEGPLHQGL